MYFVYDTLDRLTQESGFDGRTQRYHYGPTGQRIRSEDAHCFYHYDRYGRLTEKDERRIHPHGSITHHYNTIHSSAMTTTSATSAMPGRALTTFIGSINGAQIGLAIG